MYHTLTTPSFDSPCTHSKLLEVLVLPRGEQTAVDGRSEARWHSTSSRLSSSPSGNFSFRYRISSIKLQILSQGVCRSSSGLTFYGVVPRRGIGRHLVPRIFYNYVISQYLSRIWMATNDRRSSIHRETLAATGGQLFDLQCVQ